MLNLRGSSRRCKKSWKHQGDNISGGGKLSCASYFYRVACGRGLVNQLLSGLVPSPVLRQRYLVALLVAVSPDFLVAQQHDLRLNNVHNNHELSRPAPDTFEFTPYFDDSLTCGQPSFQRSLDREIFIWNDCGTNNWHVMSSAGANGPNDERVYSNFDGQITSSAALSGVMDAGTTLEATDELRTNFDNTGLSFHFGMASGFNGIDSFVFESRADADLCLDMSLAGPEQRVLFGAGRNIIDGFPVNIRDLSANCGSRCDDGIQNGDETGIDCGGSCRDCSVPPFVSQCLARPGPVTRITGMQYKRYRLSTVAENSIFNATGAIWSGLDEQGNAIPWTITFRNDGNGANSCWYGGEINGPWDENDDDVSWEDPFHHSGGMTIDIDDFLFEAVRVNNQGDGLRPYGENARIRSAWLTDIHDDCVENDDLYTLTVENSFFDGCYSGFSARPHVDNPPDGSSNLWTIRDSLMRLEPQPTVYRGPVPGHGGFFKWDGPGRSPQVSLHNTVFRADQNPNHGTLGIPNGLNFESCSDNTMVWLGEGPFPEPLPDCFRITTDVQVWNDAVADWKARHAGVFE